MTVASRAAAAFTSEHGRAPASVWSAPGRVNLIGEHTDYNDGFVLPFALPHRTAVAVAPRSDGTLTLATLDADDQLHRLAALRISELTPGHPAGWGAYPAGVAWVLREAGIAVPGADVVIAGAVPTGAGLSSSAALECATALALLHTAGIGIDTPNAPSLSRIARWAQRAENEFAGAPTGVLDQTASLRCTGEHALFYDVRTQDAEQIPFNVRESGLELLVIDTQVKHAHSESGYGQRRRGCEQAAGLLGVTALRDIPASGLSDALAALPSELRPLTRHVVTENERVLDTVKLLQSGQPQAIGTLLTASHTSLRDDYRVSCAELDVAVMASLDSGAIGARMTGGGFGGSAIALLESGKRESIEQAVLDAFREQGWIPPRLFTAVPAAGAGRDQ